MSRSMIVKIHDRYFLRPKIRIFCMHLFWKPIYLGHFSVHLSTALGNKALNRKSANITTRIIIRAIEWYVQIRYMTKSGVKNCVSNYNRPSLLLLISDYTIHICSLSK